MFNFLSPLIIRQLSYFYLPSTPTLLAIKEQFIGKAIELSLNSFDFENAQSKAIIVITDGENHEDDAIEMADDASKKSVFVHTIGMGSIEGGPIPIKTDMDN